MRVLVCGGRDFNNTRAVFAILSGLRPKPTKIIHGGARGADSLSGVWAKHAGVPCSGFPAQWDLYGKAAGFRRNAEMLTIGKPDLVLAFAGGRGTADMVARSVAHGCEVFEIPDLI